MSLYLDTSVVVAAFVREVHSERVDRWLNEQDHADLIVSGWVVAEFSGALANKLRRADINELQRTAALSSFSRLCSHSLTVVPVGQEAFYRAAGIANQYEFGVRAADALHVAIAFDHGATLCTLDRRLCEAGPAFGVPTIAVGSLFC